MIKLAALLFAVAACCSAQACPTTTSLHGFLQVEQCDPARAQCVPAEQALYDHTRAAPASAPDVMRISTHGSPWHLYDGDFRILEIDEVAAMVKQDATVKRVNLVASWSGAMPVPHARTLARKLSAALGGMPVTGQDGFVWVAPDGSVRTTRQALTGRAAGPYLVGRNDDVMTSMVAGWPLYLEDAFVKQRDGAGLLRMGAAKEIFLLCPDDALKSYEQGAALNNPVAAFNAAILRLERGQPGDVAAAMTLLRQAAAQGDEKAGKKLKSLAGATAAH